MVLSQLAARWSSDSPAELRGSSATKSATSRLIRAASSSDGRMHVSRNNRCETQLSTRSKLSCAANRTR